jgi:hypothetical protein
MSLKDRPADRSMAVIPDIEHQTASTKSTDKQALMSDFINPPVTVLYHATGGLSRRNAQVLPRTREVTSRNHSHGKFHSQRLEYIANCNDQVIGSLTRSSPGVCC